MDSQAVPQAPGRVSREEPGSLLRGLFPTSPRLISAPSLPSLVPGWRLTCPHCVNGPLGPGLLVGVCETRAARRLRAEGRGSLPGGESVGAVARGLGGLAEGPDLVDTAASAAPVPYPPGLGAGAVSSPGVLQHPSRGSLTLSTPVSSPNPPV